jgi:hypothetical protein
MGKFYGIWNADSRMISGLLSDADVDKFFDSFDNEFKQWYTEEEDPAISAAPVITLDEALKELNSEWLGI